jgi:hypothetical protein
MGMVVGDDEFRTGASLPCVRFPLLLRCFSFLLGREEPITPPIPLSRRLQLSFLPLPIRTEQFKKDKYKET